MDYSFLQAYSESVLLQLIQNFLMAYLYNFSIFFYQVMIRVAALFGNEKAKLWVAGRRKIFKRIQQSLKFSERRVWFHCASLGEFEQGRPLIEKFRSENDEIKIVLTFFSPSGFEFRKNYSGADYVFYLPIDTRSNASRFVSLIHPEKVFFIKYEYWFHYLKKLRKRGIPVYLVSAIFRPDQRFFKWYGRFFRRMLRNVSHFFVQDEASAHLLQSIGVKKYTVTGDTRFDRVLEIANNAKSIPLVEQFKDGKKMLVAGSTWHEDDELLSSIIQNFVKQELKFLIVPHEIGHHQIGQLEYLLIEKAGLTPSDIFLFSSPEGNPASAKVMILDTVGLLSSAYRYGEIAYIGGGFGKGIHNILEAAVYGMPVFFGPNHLKFREATELIEAGGAFSVIDGSEFTEKLSPLINDTRLHQQASSVAKNYVSQRKGATEKILEFIEEQTKKSLRDN